MWCKMKATPPTHTHHCKQILESYAISNCLPPTHYNSSEDGYHLITNETSHSGGERASCLKAPRASLDPLPRTSASLDIVGLILLPDAKQRMILVQIIPC